jgi:Nitrile hydratase beta subunit.
MSKPSEPPRFRAGDRVRIRVAYPIGHCRTPFYVRGARGEVERHCGAFANPEGLAYGRDGLPTVHLYRVRVPLAWLWQGYQGMESDAVEVEIYEHWIEAVDEGDSNA